MPVITGLNYLAWIPFIYLATLLGLLHSTNTQGSLAYPIHLDTWIRYLVATFLGWSKDRPNRRGEG